MRIAHHWHQLFNVNETDGVIEMSPAQRKTRVPRLEHFFHVRLEIVFKIKINDFAARRHDVADNALA